MDKHENKECPRCKRLFICKVGDVANCQCNDVSLLEGTRAFLEKTYYDCLCSNCMAEINQMVKFSLHHAFPRQKELMLEGIHYYYEGKYFVFTELYHLQRGFCCNNGCRNCAYGFRSKVSKG